MLFSYTALTKSGEERSGAINASNEDIAISSLQQRSLVVVSIRKAEKKPIFERDIGFLTKVSGKDLVMLSRQISTLFEAQVSALRVFRLLGTEFPSAILREKLSAVADDIQSGMTISKAMNKHPAAFSDFYVNMVHAGEESGKLSEAFGYLSSYMERNYELISKTRSALMYPAFVIFVFITVMALMMTLVVPKLTAIILESGQEIPIYTKIVINTSNFLVNYGILSVLVLVVGVVLLWYYNRKGVISFSKMKIGVPLVGKLYSQIYLSRIADNMNTMLSSGIPMVRAVEITAKVVGDETYKAILAKGVEKIKAGSPLSKALEGHKEIPRIMLQMIKVGEETGELGQILGKMAAFYKREVDQTIDTLVGMIEPILIVALGLGVGTVLAAVLMPIYNIAGSM